MTYEQVQVYQFLAVVCHLWWWVESLMFAEGCSEIGMQLEHDLWTSSRIQVLAGVCHLSGPGGCIPVFCSFFGLDGINHAFSRCHLSGIPYKWEMAQQKHMENTKETWEVSATMRTISWQKAVKTLTNKQWGLSKGDVASEPNDCCVSDTSSSNMKMIWSNNKRRNDSQ